MNATKRRDLETRFALLEDRVFKIELRLGPETSTPIAEAPPFATPFATAAATAPPAPVEAGAAAPTIKIVLPTPHAVPPPLPRMAQATVRAPVITPVVPDNYQPAQTSTLPYATPAPVEPLVQSKLERTIGLKWAGWAGAIVLVAGAAFGVKYIYDQHWFSQVPPAVWLSAIFAAGLALIALGEVIYRRVHAIPAASVFGAGIATLFLAGYVGHAYYNLYSPSAALFLMAAAALVGALVAMRGNLVSIAVLSLLGANIAPLLVGSRNAPLESFLVYLLALQMVALSLSTWGHGKKWWALRGLSLASTSLWVIGIGLQPDHEAIVSLFAAVYAVLYHVELIHSALRHRDDSQSETAKGDIVGPDAITFALLVTAALTLVILWATRLLEPHTRAGILLATAAASALCGFLLTRGKTTAPLAIRRISSAHRIAAAGLIALAVPVAFSGLQTDLAWGLLALAFALGGATTQSKISRVAGIVVWFLGLFHLAIASQLPPELGGHPATVWFSLFGTPITREAGLAFALSIAGQIIAGLNAGRKSQADRSAISLSIVATAVWVVASILALPPLAATAWIVEYAWLLVAAEALVPQLRFSLQAAVLITLATVKWAIIDTLADRLSPGWSAATYRPVLNPMMGIGALLCASIATLYSIRRNAILRALRKQDDLTTGSIVALLTVIVALLTFGLSFEIDRIVEVAVSSGQALLWPVTQEKLLAFTILWSVASMVLLCIVALAAPAGQERSRWYKRFWILPAILAAKYILIDTAFLWGASSASVLLNLQVLAAATIAATLLLGNWLSRRDAEGDLSARRLQSTAILLATAVLMWALTLEIDRLCEQMQAAGTLHWPLWQAKQLGWTIAWSIATAAAFAWLRYRNPNVPANHIWPRLLPQLLMLLAVKYLTIDTVLWRLLNGPANVPVLANLETAAGAIVFASLVVLWAPGLPVSLKHHRAKLHRIAGLIASLIVLWIGSIEIDRYFAAAPIVNSAVRPEQVAISIFWSIFAVASVLLGFRIRSAGLRYFGLGLLALTLLKVVVIDMSQVQTGYRILSFMGLGALLLGTSVLYGKLGPLLLADDHEEESHAPIG